MFIGRQEELHELENFIVPNLQLGMQM